MKKIISLLSAAACIMLITGCKKIIDNLVPTIPDEPIQTAVGFPTGFIANKTIGNSGGFIASADGRAELIFPAGALADNVNITIQAITNNAPNGMGNAYRFLPEGIKFLQPVTLKIHYTASDLASTLADLMGIAFQDSVGTWYRINNFTNDPVNKTISAPINHFSDWSMFEIMSIAPSAASVKVDETIELEVTRISPESDDEEVAPLLQKIDKIVWSASAGTLTGSDDKSRVFTAPPKIPSQNPVAISAQIQISFKYHGKTFNKTSLVSNITIYDKEKYLLELRETETADPFIYTDTASLEVLIAADGKVSVSNILNFAPKMNIATATLGDCTATWQSDPVGEMNVTGVTGTLTSSVGDPNRLLTLEFTHSGTVSPKFYRVCSGGGGVTDGGIDMQGVPTLLTFVLTPDAGIYFQDDGQEFARLTLQ